MGTKEGWTAADKELAQEQLRELELRLKKAELEAAKGGGGGNFTQNNIDGSSNQNVTQNRQENISLRDSEQDSVGSVNP